jgi:phenylacetyl-CoA:acceptor oxidoreductase subunit 1
MTHWAMTIDLRRCIGCKTCVMACSQANQVEEGLWRRLQEIGHPEPPERQRFFMTAACMHCNKPACMTVCPTTATYQRSDGIVAIDADKCVGCGACIMACPYDARAITSNRHRFESENTLGAESDGQYQQTGTCTKCSFCLPRVRSGLDKKQQPGHDPDATPLCVVTCSSDALCFGDLDDPNSRVSNLIKKNKTIRLSEELGTDPSVYYIVSS